ncbi:MAG: WYL domain-containing protein [Streptosporangiaceae bacterium]
MELAWVGDLCHEPTLERSASVRVVDPYGLVCKAGIWYLVADSDGEPRLFRVSRVVSATAHEEPVRRRDGVSGFGDRRAILELAFELG